MCFVNLQRADTGEIILILHQTTLVDHSDLETRDSLELRRPQKTGFLGPKLDTVGMVTTANMFPSASLLPTFVLCADFTSFVYQIHH